jgi:tRNA (guanine26-N2/guanine27-N2)-dimethyltransferase
VRLGGGFFRPESRPSRDLGVLLGRQLAGAGPLRVLDAMAGCGIRALRYGLEAGAEAVWANDADPDRLPLVMANLAPLGDRARATASTAQHLLAGCLQRQERFELVDLDAFGCPTPLLPLAIEAVAFGGVLYLASTDGRSPTGHDRRSAIRSLGAAARAHPASWELALRLQLASQARVAWALGRGLEPLVAFSEGRTFRTAVRITRHPAPRAEEQLGLLAHCHGCGDQQVQPLLQLRQWQPCACAPGTAPPLAISGPLWIGPLQHSALLEAMGRDPATAALPRPTGRLLAQLQADPAPVARCWPTAELARRLSTGPPRLEALVQGLRQQGWQAWPSAVMAAQLRTDAPWPLLLELAAALTAGSGPDTAK